MPQSINNHSIRIYENERGEIVSLDRNNSFSPPSFELSKPFEKRFYSAFELSKPFEKRFCGIVSIVDRNFCDGKSWKSAEKKMREIYAIA